MVGVFRTHLSIGGSVLPGQPPANDRASLPDTGLL